MAMVIFFFSIYIIKVLVSFLSSFTHCFYSVKATFTFSE